MRLHLEGPHLEGLQLKRLHLKRLHLEKGSTVGGNRCPYARYRPTAQARAQGFTHHFSTFHCAYREKDPTDTPATRLFTASSEFAEKPKLYG